MNKFFNHSVEKATVGFFKKIKYGNLKVSFPSGKFLNFKGRNQGIEADIKLNNFFFEGYETDLFQEFPKGQFSIIQEDVRYDSEGNIIKGGVLDNRFLPPIDL